MRTKSEVIVEHWLHNKNNILNLNDVAKLVFGNNCSSNRAKVKPHVLSAKQTIEEDHKFYVYEMRDGKKVLGYKIATTVQERGMYEIDLKRRIETANHHHRKAINGQANLLKNELPYNTKGQICLNG